MLTWPLFFRGVLKREQSIVLLLCVLWAHARMVSNDCVIVSNPVERLAKACVSWENKNFSYYWANIKLSSHRSGCSVGTDYGTQVCKYGAKFPNKLPRQKSCLRLSMNKSINFMLWHKPCISELYRKQVLEFYFLGRSVIKRTLTQPP